MKLHLLIVPSIYGLLLFLSFHRVRAVSMHSNLVQADTHLAHYNHEVSSSSFGEPVFRLEPPTVINFDSSLGTTIPCLASGSPRPTITWYTASSTESDANDSLSPLVGGDSTILHKPIGNVTGLRQIINNGASIRLLPFKSSDFQPDIHSTEYRCTASNNLATIHSRSCLVQAVDPEEPFEVKVSDEFVALGEAAVLKCRPRGASQPELGQLEEWTTSDGLRILPLHTSGDKASTTATHNFVAFATGELHLIKVEMADLRRSYGCRWRNSVTGVSVESSGLAQLILLPDKQQQQQQNSNKVLHSVNQLIVEDADYYTLNQATTTLIPCALKHTTRNDRVTWLFQPATKATPPKPIQHLPIELSRRFKQAPTYLAIERLNSALAGRYLCQLAHETLCDTTVILRQPLRLKLLQHSFLSSTHSPNLTTNNILNSDINYKTIQTPAFHSWLQVMDPLQQQPQLEGAPQRPASLVSDDDEPAPSSSSFLTPADSSSLAALVRAHGPGFIRPPQVVPLGHPLRLECHASGQPLDTVRWFRNGRAINTQLAVELQAEISDLWTRQQELNFSGKESNWRLVSLLQVRQVQAQQAGLQVYECLAQNSLGERARAGTVLFVADWPLLEWAANQCLVHQSTNGTGDTAVGVNEESSWMMSSSGSSIIDGESIFRRLNPLKQALLIEGEQATLECPTSTNFRANTGTEWRRLVWADSQTRRTSTTTTTTTTTAQLSNVAGSESRNFNQLFMGDSRFVINGSSLQIRSPSKRHDEALYVCRSGPQSAIHQQLYRSSSGASSCMDRPSEWIQQQQQQQVSSSISIRILAKPKIDPFEFSRTLEEGQRTWAVCGVSSGEGPIEISWFKDGQLLVADEEAISIEAAANHFSSTLTLHHIKQNHSGLYTCVASNSFATTNHSSRLLVNVAPYFVEPPQSRRAILGSSVLINCRAGGEPSPQIRWRKLVPALAPPSGIIDSTSSLANPEYVIQHLKPNQEFRIVTSNSHIQILENGSMLIKDLELNDGSRYLCQASNGINPSLSEMIELTVLSPPQFELNYETVSVKRDATIKFNCAPRGDQPMRIQWLKEAHPLVRSNSSTDSQARSTKYTEILHLASSQAFTDAPVHHYNLLAGTQQLKLPNQLPSGERLSELLISYADRSDTGAFICQANNAHGFDTITYRLTVQEPPDQPTGLAADTVQANSLKLTWLAPFDGNLPLSHFVVEYRRMLSEAKRGGKEEFSGSTSAAEWMRIATPVMQSGARSGQQLIAGGSSSNLTEHGIVLRQLEARTAYQVRVAALNGLGQGAFSEPLVVNTVEEPPVSRAVELRAQPLSSNSIKIQWQAPSLVEEQAPIAGYHVRYRKFDPSSSPSSAAVASSSSMTNNNNNNKEQLHQQPWLGISSISSTNVTRNIQLPAGTGAMYELLISGLEKSTRYEISVQPYNGMGVGPSVETLGQTLKFNRPGQPNLRLVVAKRQSLELKWQLLDDEQPVLGFTLFYKCEYDDWLRIQLALVYHYIIEGLRCGNRYQVYLTAFNAIGVSEASQVISARTEGSAPIAPDKSKFLRANISEVQLDVVSWQSGGCPITSFMVQFKRLHDSNWFILTGAQTTPFPNSDQITIPDLLPATWYKLLVSALNEAGSTNAEYLFSTLDLEGHPIAPLIGSSEPQDEQESKGGSSMLHQLLGLATFQSNGSGANEATRHLLVPASCLLLLLITSLLSYLYYHSKTSHTRQQEISINDKNNHQNHPNKSNNNTIDNRPDGQLMQRMLLANHQHQQLLNSTLQRNSSCVPDSFMDALQNTQFSHQLPPTHSINLCNVQEGSLLRNHIAPNNYHPQSSSMSTQSTVFDGASGSSAQSSSGASSGRQGAHITQALGLSEECSPQDQLLHSNTSPFMMHPAGCHQNSPAHNGSLYSSSSAYPPMQQPTNHICPDQQSQPQPQVSPEITQPFHHSMPQRFHSASFASAAELMQRQATASNTPSYSQIVNLQGTTCGSGSQNPDSVYQRLENFQPAYGLMTINKQLSLTGRSHTLKYGTLGINSHLESTPMSSFDDQVLMRSLHLPPPQQQQQIPQDCSLDQEPMSSLVQPQQLPQQQSHVMCIEPN